MPHALAHAVELVTTVLTVAGMGYFLAALIAARVFLLKRRAPLSRFAPGVSVLKSLKGLAPGMLDAFRSHCRQDYDGPCELLFGVSTLASDDWNTGSATAARAASRSFAITGSGVPAGAKRPVHCENCAS